MSKLSTAPKATVAKEAAPKIAKKKLEAQKAPEPEPATPVAEAAPAPEAEAEQGPSIKERMELLIKSNQEIMLNLKSQIAELKKLQRDHDLLMKDALKKTKGKRRAPRDDSKPRRPSGFASPVVVSDALYAFLARFGVKKGDPVARTEVTKYINSYIKEHDLQNPDNRREIRPDATLKKVLGDAQEKDPSNPGSANVWTYMKLQRYISPHFPKKAAN